MKPRDPHEAHRASTPLELLFDLCFVVAIAQLAARLHHAILEHHVVAALPAFAMVFFAIWWAWMNFTWFASAYDVDDTPYRAKVLVQIVGVLVLAAGVPRAFERGDFAVVTFGYTIMRVSLVLHWLRAARRDPRGGRTQRRYALGLAVVQLLWIAALALPADRWWLAAVTVIPLELALPWWAERTGTTPWHAHHIAERYGLLTLIVLGESVLSTTVAIQAAIDRGGVTADIAGIVAGGVLTLFSMWWLYFDAPIAHHLRSNREGFIWGYGHFVVFGAAAAVGAGLGAAVDQTAPAADATHELSAVAAGLAVAVPVALFVASVWLLQVRPSARGPSWAVAFALGLGAIIGAAWAPCPVLWIGLAMAGLVAWTVAAGARAA